MQVQKLRAPGNGLVPAGAYFAEIAAKLEDMNARAAALQQHLDEEDRALEALYRPRSAARSVGRDEQHAMM
ncbi:MAG: hypothetical protein AB7H66_10960 [Hyphomonadaceae bacterium]